MKNYFKYIIEGVVIILSVFLSFYFEDVRKTNENFETKNELVSDLIVSLDDDLNQINNLIEILTEAENDILAILSDIDSKHKNFTDLEAVKTLLGVEVGISFFPKDGIFEQLISTGTFSPLGEEYRVCYSCALDFS